MHTYIHTYIYIYIFIYVYTIFLATGWPRLDKGTPFLDNLPGSHIYHMIIDLGHTIFHDKITIYRYMNPRGSNAIKPPTSQRRAFRLFFPGVESQSAFRWAQSTHRSGQNSDRSIVPFGAWLTTGVSFRLLHHGRRRLISRLCLITASRLISRRGLKSC